MPHPEFTGRVLEDALRSTGALLEGHFLLSSGMHSPRYIQCARLLMHPAFAERAGRSLASLFGALAPRAVLSPALGGVVIGQEVARALGVRAMFAEREGAGLALRRGFELEPGEPVLLVEDVVTTGKSIGELADLTRALGAHPVGFGSIVDRSGGELGRDLGGAMTVRALIALDVPRFAPDDCPACQAGIPVVKPGSRPAAEPRKTS